MTVAVAAVTSCLYCLSGLGFESSEDITTTSYSNVDLDCQMFRPFQFPLDYLLPHCDSTNSSTKRLSCAFITDFDDLLFLHQLHSKVDLCRLCSQVASFLTEIIIVKLERCLRLCSAALTAFSRSQRYDCPSRCAG